MSDCGKDSAHTIEENIDSKCDFGNSSCDEELYNICASVEEKTKCDNENSSYDKEIDEIFAKVEENNRDVARSFERGLCDVCEAVKTTVNVTIQAGRERKSLSLLKNRRNLPLPSTSCAGNVTGIAKKTPAENGLTSTLAASKLRRKRRCWTSEIDDLFAGISKPSRKQRKQSSTLERTNKEGKKTYISTKADDSSNATHLIKLEIYDLKTLARVPASQRWKCATVKAKYYSKGPKNKNLQMAKKMVFNVAEEIAKS